MAGTRVWVEITCFQSGPGQQKLSAESQPADSIAAGLGTRLVGRHIMKRIMSISEIVDSHEVMKGTREVIATADANYDEARQELVMDMDSRAIVTDVRGHESKLPEDWLPNPETIRERVPSEEAQPLARELFHRWTTKVRATIPPP